MNTNQLHKQEYIDKSTVNPHFIKLYGSEKCSPRIFPKSRDSLVSKTGLTKKIKSSEISKLMELVEKGNYLGSANLLIEYTKESEANKIAKNLKRLADNPAFKLNVTFKKVSNEN